ncbi:MAG TPA: LysR family transcriptional regulator [Victivallales bacterium]|nr:LysR family transcriptional regulator [Victivallales bacterium]
MNLSGINLNLLVVLNALLAEKSVSLAARKLKMTQPAVSHMLKQLRIIFDDDLLVRGPSNQMILTKCAKDLIIPVSEAIIKFENIFIKQKSFDISVAEADFKIGMSDYASLLYMKGLSEIIENEANNISFTINHLNNLHEYDEFDSKNLDLAIGFFSVDTKNIISEQLFLTELVCIAAKDHPAFNKRKLSINTFFEYPYLNISFRSDCQELVSQTIYKKTGKKLKISITTPHLLVALNTIQSSHYLAIVHENIAKKFAEKFDIDYHDLPFPSQKMIYSMYWKREDDSNESHQWLRNTIRQITDQNEII